MTKWPLPIRGQRRRGAFISLEGIEGAGKSTQVRHILARLAEAQVKAIATREPGGSPGAEILRKVLLSGIMEPLGPAAEAILFAAARIDHIDHTIEPALAAGTCVVCDRFADSSRAYQGASGDLDPRFFRALERVTLGEVWPDVTLILDLPAAEGLARASSRRSPNVELDRFESESLRFHEAVRRNFLTIAAENPDRCIVIDAARSESIVEHEIWDAISDRLFRAEIAKQIYGA